MGQRKTRQPGIAVTWVECDFFTDPGWLLDLLVRVGKLDLGENQPVIGTLETIDRPKEAIMMTDLISGLADDPC